MCNNENWYGINYSPQGEDLDDLRNEWIRCRYDKINDNVSNGTDSLDINDSKLDKQQSLRNHPLASCPVFSPVNPLDFNSCFLGFIMGEDDCICIGDYIESCNQEKEGVAGTVIGIIEDGNNDAVCYKIWGYNPMLGGEGFNYIPKCEVGYYEPCDDTETALTAIGYKLRHEQLIPDAEDAFNFYYNEVTRDIIPCITDGGDVCW